MKNIKDKRLSFLLACLVFFVFSSIAFGQEQNKEILAVVEYMKVKDGQFDEYRDVESKIWKPVHRQRIESGEILGWYLWQVQYPGGVGKEYDYITVTVFDDFAKLENPLSNYSDVMAKVHPDLSLDKIEERTIGSRDLLRGEVFGLIDQATDKKEGPSKFIRINFMKSAPSMAEQYVELEQKYYKHAHQVRTDNGGMAGWQLWGRILPSGSSHVSDFVTIDGFESYEQMRLWDDQWKEQIMQKVELKMTDEEAWEKMEPSRDMVDSEMWKLVDFVAAGKEEILSGK